MSLIDTTYFINKLRLPQVTNTDGATLVSRFISAYEPRFLEEALGYEMSKAFVLGLQEPTIAQRWTDLLTGVEFTYGTRLHKWNGFISLSSGLSLLVNSSAIFETLVGGPGAYDPVNLSATATIPPQFVGKQFSVEQQGYGRLRSNQYSVVGNTITLLGGLKFTTGVTYFYVSDYSISISGTNTDNKYSPIAAYVFFKFMEDKATDNALIGAVVPKGENATREDGGGKMVAAWNEMVEYMSYLKGFLIVNRTVYPEWQNRSSEIYHKINIFSI